MAGIGKHIDTEKNLTIYELQGEISVDELLKLNEKFLTGYATSNIIFDVMDGSLKKITKDGLENNVLKIRAEKRKERKIAIVGKKDVDFGMGRMYAAYLKIENAGVNIDVFRTRSEALKWLGLG